MDNTHAAERAQEIIAGWKANKRGVVDYADIERTITASLAPTPPQARVIAPRGE